MIDHTEKQDVRTDQANLEIEHQPDWLCIDRFTESLGYCFDVRLEPDADKGGYVAHVPQLSGVVSQGINAAEAIDNTIEAFKACIEAYEQEDMPIPWNPPQRRLKGDIRIVLNV